MQRVTIDTGAAFAPVERALYHTFFPALFSNDAAAGEKTHQLLSLPTKWAGLTIPDPTTTAQTNYASRILACSHLLAVFQGVEPFQPSTHTSVISAVMREIK